MSSEKQKEIREQFDELKKHYRELILEDDESGLWKIKGKLRFSASYNNEIIQDVFKVEIVLPVDYPESVPIVKETEGRIPAEFHKYSDTSLCLGSPFNVKKKFQECPTLLWFVEDILVHYLFSFCVYERSGVMPFGELSHERGMIDSYKELFGLETDMQTLQMLRLMAENKYKGHLACPCESGERIRNCHGPLLTDISRHQRTTDFFRDYAVCIMEYVCTGHQLPISLRSKKLVKYFGTKKADCIFERKNNRTA